jgi:hypothetical protein
MPAGGVGGQRLRARPPDRAARSAMQLSPTVQKKNLSCLLLTRTPPSLHFPAASCQCPLSTPLSVSLSFRHVFITSDVHTCLHAMLFSSLETKRSEASFEKSWPRINLLDTNLDGQYKIFIKIK